MRWLDGTTGSKDRNLSKLQEILEDRGAWRVAVHRVWESQTWLSTFITVVLILCLSSCAKMCTSILTCLILIINNFPNWTVLNEIRSFKNVSHLNNWGVRSRLHVTHWAHRRLSWHNTPVHRGAFTVPVWSWNLETGYISFCTNSNWYGRLQSSSSSRPGQMLGHVLEGCHWLHLVTNRLSCFQVLDGTPPLPHPTASAHFSGPDQRVQMCALILTHPALAECLTIYTQVGSSLLNLPYYYYWKSRSNVVNAISFYNFPSIYFLL